MIILFVLLNVSFRTCCIELVIDSCFVLAVAFSISPMSSLPLFLHCLPSYFATVFSPIPPLSSLSFLHCHSSTVFLPFLHCIFFHSTTVCLPFPSLSSLPFTNCFSFHSLMVSLPFLHWSPFHSSLVSSPIPPLSSLLCFCVWHQIRSRFAPLSINFPLTNNSWYRPDPVMKNRHGTWKHALHQPAVFSSFSFWHPLGHHSSFPVILLPAFLLTPSINEMLMISATAADASCINDDVVHESEIINQHLDKTDLRGLFPVIGQQRPRIEVAAAYSASLHTNGASTASPYPLPLQVLIPCLRHSSSLTHLLLHICMCSDSKLYVWGDPSLANTAKSRWQKRVAVRS